MNRTDFKTDRFDVRTTSDSHFSWLRTRLALERTLMAWIRTSVALIGFGFTITQFLQRVRSPLPADQVLLPNAPRYLGLSLIGCGIVGLFVSSWQYYRTVKYLWSGRFHVLAGIDDKPYQSPLSYVVIILGGAGIFAFVTVLFRLS